MSWYANSMDGPADPANEPWSVDRFGIESELVSFETGALYRLLDSEFASLFVVTSSPQLNVD